MKKRKAKKAPKKARPLTSKQRLTIARFKLRQLRKAFDDVVQQREDLRVQKAEGNRRLLQQDAMILQLRGWLGIHDETRTLRTQLDDMRKAYDSLLADVVKARTGDVERAAGMAPAPTKPATAIEHSDECNCEACR